MVSGPSTRQRLLEAAPELFARSGYRGASVRDICDAARANPGAVSYHFGSKRQLYRAVLRRAADEVAAAVEDRLPGNAPPSPAEAAAAVSAAFAHLRHAFRLLLRDLADGGDGAVESFAPLLRSAMDHVLEERGIDHDPSARNATIEAVLRSMAPVFFLLAAWPVLHRALELPDDAMEEWIQRLT
ncbi:MAG: TetR/AcrR family transcriptional regulator [Acidobacteria bacterium]|nr:TetR/AcrR family transcriptional regulator [Acidobacteriota bacterium]